MVLIDGQKSLTEEEKRLKQDAQREKYWKKWGPYVAERQWATGQKLCSTMSTPNANFFTVREDYSADGDAWSREFQLLSNAIFIAEKLLQTSHTINPASEPTVGERTVSQASAIHTGSRTLHSLSGTARSKSRFAPPIAPSIANFV